MRSMQKVGFFSGARASWLIVLGLLLALISGCATRARIEGVVIAPRAGKHTPAGHSKLENAVVYAVPKNNLVPPRKVLRDALGETADGFEPSVLFVTQNTEVEILNRDKIYHSPFSISPAKRFDLGPLRPGEKRTVLFDRIGVVQIFCALHPESWGFVVALPDGLYARPGPDGAFTLPRIPEGEYTLKVWDPALGEKSRKVKVPKNGRVELKLAY